MVCVIPRIIFSIKEPRTAYWWRWWAVFSALHRGSVCQSLSHLQSAMLIWVQDDRCSWYDPRWRILLLVKHLYSQPRGQHLLHPLWQSYAKYHTGIFLLPNSSLVVHRLNQSSIRMDNVTRSVAVRYCLILASISVELNLDIWKVTRAWLTPSTMAWGVIAPMASNAIFSFLFLF